MLLCQKKRRFFVENVFTNGVINCIENFEHSVDHERHLIVSGPFHAVTFKREWSRTGEANTL
jgi:hypothetical protein